MVNNSLQRQKPCLCSLKGDMAHIYCSTFLNHNENQMNLSSFFLLQIEGDTYLYLKEEVMSGRKKLVN